jgi:hypothetical protein
MKKLLLAVPLASFLLAGCLVAPGPEGMGLVVVPPLPAVVILENEPYYYNGGYYYYYDHDRWSYSHSRSGPWLELPRDRYPREVRWKDREQNRRRDERDRD